MHEDIPILNFLVPKAFTHENGRLTGVTFEKVKAEYDDKGRRKLVPTGEPDPHFECDDVLVAVGQENAFPWIERDIGIEFDNGTCPWSIPRRWAQPIPKVFFGGDCAFGPKNIIWAVAHGHDAALSIHKLCSGEDITERPLPQVTVSQPEDGHPRVELRQRHLVGRALPRAAARQGCCAARHQDGGRARLRSQTRVRGGATLPELRRADGVRLRRCASNATPASTSARWTASPSPRMEKRRSCARGSRRQLRT